MKNIVLVFIMFLAFNLSKAQKLENCSNCSTLKYSNSSIENNELFELQLLRNEIFARHGYVFNNSRLGDYFSKYKWYNPDYKNPIKDINLNSIEKHNVNIIKAKEAEILKNRDQIIVELNSIKLAVRQKDKIALKRIFNQDYASIDPALLKLINDVITDSALENIHWFKGNALYKMTIDNGLYKAKKSIYMSGNTIKISSAISNSSELMKDNPFEYPSDYYSEKLETSLEANFKFVNGKLLFYKTIFAG